jgi:acyl carrier protein
MEVQNLQGTEMPAHSSGNFSQSQSSKAEKIEEWLISYLADLLEMDKDEMDITATFERYGLDSASAVGLVGDLEEWLGCNLDSTIMYDYPTIESLAKYLSTLDT